jgi:hypothetical protein
MQRHVVAGKRAQVDVAGATGTGHVVVGLAAGGLAVGMFGEAAQDDVDRALPVLDVSVADVGEDAARLDPTLWAACSMSLRFASNHDGRLLPGSAFGRRWVCDLSVAP